MEFICINCGGCCLWGDYFNRDGYLDSDYWLKGELTNDQQKQLIEERKKYPPGDGCGMLVFELGKSVCLVEKLYGKEAKPVKCQEYPFGHPEIFCYTYRKRVVKEITFDPDSDCLRIKTADGTEHERIINERIT